MRPINQRCTPHHCARTPPIAQLICLQVSTEIRGSGTEEAVEQLFKVLLIFKGNAPPHTFR